VAAGIVGLLLSGVCAFAGLLFGWEVPPEGNLMDTATFNGAVGLFTLTMAVLALGADWTNRGLRRWTGILVILTLYAYGIETIQAFRGLDPRFSRSAGPIDQLAGLFFFLAALGIMAGFIVLALKYFSAEATPVRVAVRYGAMACMIGFITGIWMSLVTQGRSVPEAGNLLVVHAAGFHGIQLIPLLALMLEKSGKPHKAVAGHVHVAGVLWVGGCVALAWQSLSGLDTFAPAPASVAAAVCFMAFGIAVVVAVGAWLGTRSGVR
jgi:hypothetical protein